MKAMVYHGPRDIRYESVADPAPTDPRGVIVKIDACSICGTDLHIYHGTASSYINGTGFCVGHEAIGEVVEVGSAVQAVKTGTKVIVPASIGCGQCVNCLRGDVRTCLVKSNYELLFGLGVIGGCQAEAVAVPAGDFNLTPIPEGVTPDQALMITDSQSTAWYGCRQAGIQCGNTVAIIGLGPIGLMAVESAFAMGAARVFAIDPLADRRTLAEAVGAETFTPESAVAGIEEATKGFGVDCVLEAVGGDATVMTALAIVRRNGRVAIVGVNKNPTSPVPLGRLLSRGVTIWMGTVPVAKTWPEILPLVASGRLRPERYITTRLKLADTLEAYRQLDERTPGVIKTVITP